jgi:hypothetical protein
VVAWCLPWTCLETGPATATGVGQTTVARQLSGVPNGTPVTGTDGKRYASWESYCETEFGHLSLPKADRSAVVLALRSAGLSTRAIGTATGLSNQTVGRELSTAPFGAVDTDRVTGLDGRDRPASAPRRAPAVEDANAMCAEFIKALRNLAA